MSNSILFQKQVRDNSTDLHSYVKELSSWEEEMKRKEISREDPKDTEVLPPVRSKNIRKSNTPKPIPSTDYSSWDKFDVDAACQELDDAVRPPSKEELLRNKERAYVEKENGNKFVKNQKWPEAIKCYTKAIKAYDSDPIFYANRALCYLKLNEYVSAEIDCTNSLRLDPTYVKAFQRRAVARIQLTQLNEAYQDLTKVMELEPNNRESLIEITKLKKKLNIIDQPKFKKVNTVVKTEKVEIKSENKKPIPKLETIELVSKAEEPVLSKIETVSKFDQNLESPPIKEISRDLQKDNLIWNDLKDQILIQPIVKPPHLRSKKPLKRINVEEIDDVPSIQKQLNVESEINEKCTEKTKDNVAEDINTTQMANSSRNEDKAVVKLSQEVNITKLDVDALPLPKTCLQFCNIWKTLGNNLNLKFKYFTKIHYNDLSNLFQEFLESDQFFDIIKVLNENFSDENSELIFNYLNSFTNVNRFSTIILFASQNDKKYVKNILDNLSKLEKISQSSINKLQKIYEV